MSRKSDRRKSVVLIAGPTASGKSALAIALARETLGCVINADAMQVYRPLSVLTARPDGEALKAAPHLLYGHIQGDAPYSVAHWRAEAEVAIREIWERDHLPIIVGGTGLYFRALEKGLATIPPIADEIREKWRQALTERGSAALHGELAVRAPDHARLLLESDSQRIVRALEVVDATGRSLIEWQQAAGEGAGATDSILANAEVIRVVLVPERGELHKRINARFVEMVSQGALAEVEKLVQLGLPADAPVNKSIGVAELTSVARGEISLEDAMPLVQARTRQFAKRQLTWFRNQMPDWPVLDPVDEGAMAAWLEQTVRSVAH